jgi:hypothetical protein
VALEIKRTRKKEKQEGRPILFPIRLTSFENILNWELFDSATVTDLADEIRSYFIPDFSNWKDKGAYEPAIKRLITDLTRA